MQAGRGERNSAADMRTGGARERSSGLGRGGLTTIAAREEVEQALELLRPTIEALVADRSVSHDQALVVVVMDPAAPDGATFDASILLQRAFGRAEEVDVDYARYALDKARASFRERCDTSILRERGAALLSADLPLVGGLHRRGWTVGVCGAVPMVDEAIGAMVIDLTCALQALAATRPATVPTV
jgi:hypothetical protein